MLKPVNTENAVALESFARNWRQWLASGALAEGMRAAAAVLDGPGAPTTEPWRARALYGAGLLAFRAGDMARSLARNEELLTQAGASGDVRGQCDALTGLARIALREGRYADVVSYARRGRELARDIGDRDAEDGPRHLEAVGERMRGDHQRAKALYLEGIAVAEEQGNVERVATEDHNLGWVELHLGDLEAAEMRFRRRDESGVADAYLDAWRDLSWAAVACLRGDRREANSRFEAGAKAIAGLGMELDPDDAMELEWLKSILAESKC